MMDILAKKDELVRKKGTTIVICGLLESMEIGDSGV